MARPSILLMLAGGGVLLVVLFVLYQSTRSEALPAEPTAPTTQARRPADPVVVPGPSPATPPAPGPIATKPAPTRDSWAPAAPVLPSAPNLGPDTGEGSSNEGLHFGVVQHRAQTAAVEPQVRECMEKASVAGIKASGTATLTHVVSKRGDKYIVEDTSFDSDGTTIQHDGLVECLHQTAKHMKYEGLPRKATSIVVTRSVKIEQGALAEYKFVTFSYLQ